MKLVDSYLGHFGLPFLKIGHTVASFQSCGTVPSCRDLLKIIDSGFATVSAQFFRTAGWISSGPCALSSFSELAIYFSLSLHLQ